MIDFSGLNTEQYSAVFSNVKRILCLAGAGTGKTRVLTHRIARLHTEGAGCDQMLALTFTRLAGEEMKERVIRLIGTEDGRKLFCNTFHAFCVDILQKNAALLGYAEGFSIYGPEDQETLLKEMLRDLGYTRLSVKRGLEMIAGGKQELEKGTQAYTLRSEYYARLLQRNAIDFDSLIMFTIRLFRQFPDLCEVYRNQYPYVFVDEFQDTSDDQWELITLLQPAHLFIVGDDFQSIYGWRNANIHIILALAGNPSYQIIKLEENYRSTIPIVQAANTLIKKNMQTQKVLRTNREGPDITVTAYGDEPAEYVAVRRHIATLNGSCGIQYREIAVLARTNRQLDAVAATLAADGIPHLVVNAVKDPLKFKDVQLIFAYMAAARNDADDTLIKKIVNFPKTVLSEKELLLAEKRQLENGGCFIDTLSGMQVMGLRGADIFLTHLTIVNGLITHFSDNPLFAFDAVADYFRLNNMYAEKGWTQSADALNAARDALIRWIDRQGEFGGNHDIVTMLNWLRLRDVTDKLVDDRDAIRLMTVHASKGLEFDIVFIIGLNEGTFPSRGDIEEERRLFYVAMTRAKTHLFISRSTLVQGWNGKPEPATESRFIREMA